MKKYRYNVISKEGEHEEWSGAFDTLELANKWFDKHGEFHQSRGHNLILVEFEPKPKKPKVISVAQ